MQKQKRPALITFSDLDGSGKTTQIEKLIGYLKEKGIKYENVWTRFGHTHLIRYFKKSSETGYDSNIISSSFIKKIKESKGFIFKSFILLSFFDLLCQYVIKVRFALLRNKFVICDRYILDALVEMGIHLDDAIINKRFLTRMIVRLS